MLAQKFYGQLLAEILRGIKTTVSCAPAKKIRKTFCPWYNVYLARTTNEKKIGFNMLIKIFFWYIFLSRIVYVAVISFC